MALTKIRGNQINTATEAIVTTLSFLNQTSVLRIPSGTQANRPTGVSPGTIRFNTDTDSACLLYTSPSPRDQRGSRMPSSA